MNHLAEWCVEHGVIDLFDDRKGEPTYAMDGEYLGTAEEAMRDWRVAGKLMERCDHIDIERDAMRPGDWIVSTWPDPDGSTWQGAYEAQVKFGSNLQTTLVEACTGALSP